MRPYGNAVASLQGVYKTSEGRIVAIRATPEMFCACPFLLFYNVEKTEQGYRERQTYGKGSNFGFAFRDRDLGHILLPDQDLQGRSLGLKVASKTEREQRSRQKGGHSFSTDRRLLNLFTNLGYEIVPPDIGKKIQIRKQGIHQPYDDLDRYHRIEAIDPKTGKARLFTFTIADPHEIKPNREKAGEINR